MTHHRRVVFFDVAWPKMVKRKYLNLHASFQQIALDDVFFLFQQLVHVPFGVEVSTAEPSHGARVPGQPDAEGAAEIDAVDQD